MNSYTSIARHYDSLTEDVDYGKFVGIYKKIFGKYKITPEIVADLGCGTGTLTLAMAEEGYDMIGVDASWEMLACAKDKASRAKADGVLFLCQPIQKLDLYGTIDAAFSSLDSMNYITGEKDFDKALKRISLFMIPGGVFIFDMQSPAALERLDRRTIVKENENIYCVWYSSFDKRT